MCAPCFTFVFLQVTGLSSQREGGWGGGVTGTDGILGFDIFNSGTYLGGLIFLGNFLRIQKNLKLSFHNVIHETEDVWVFRVLLESRRLLNSAWELLEGSSRSTKIRSSLPLGYSFGK